MYRTWRNASAEASGSLAPPWGLAEIYSRRVVRSRTASHSIHELVAVKAVRYHEYSVSFQVCRVLELLICRFDYFFRDASSAENVKEILLRQFG
jgi:hypothetical protein